MTMDRSLPAGVPTAELNVWQKRQATLLYHFASLDYLKGLKQRIDALIAGIDPVIEERQALGVDQFLINERWGARDTVANWSTYGFPALVDFQQKTAKQIAKRAYEAYSITGANQCARMLSELSMQWATDEEEQAFNERAESVYRYARYIDDVMERPNGLNDGIFYNTWMGTESEFQELRFPRHAALFPRLPKFRIRTDVVAEAGKRPPRTGVYVPQADPYGTLQFGWTGNEWDGSLDDCRTFNELGLDVVASVGRDDLWNGSPALHAFVKRNYGKQLETHLRGKAFFELDDLNNPRRVPAFLSARGFTTRPCKWHFVEVINDEYEDDADSVAAPTGPLRIAAGKPCPQPGWWFTPAKQGSRRHFKLGDVFPEIEGSSYGATFWQWSPDQSDPRL